MRKVGFTAVLITLAALTAMAQDDPPSRAARLSYAEGQVSFRPGSADEWTQATLNYPLTSGDHLWTERGARAELHVGSTAIRMNSETALSLLTLDDRLLQVSVTQGTVQIRVRELLENESVEVATPNAAITLLRPGVYRIDADGDSNTTLVTVRAGDADATGGGLAIAIHSGQQARISGLDELTQQTSVAASPDEFEDWCASRDDREDRSQTARYVPREMTGYEDLDTYGGWRQESDYGWVWAPASVPVGWAPYRFGRWVWISPWGWTWVDDEPWGFAPFHYGRWGIVNGQWIWIPGSWGGGVRPIYSPALVVFLGGPRFGSNRATFAAWFPLGPREPYRPVYRASDAYLRNLNRGTNDLRDGRYRNQSVAEAVTAVPQRDFVGGRSVRRVAVNVDRREIDQSPVQGGAPGIAPDRISALGDAARRSAPPARFEDRRVVVNRAPAAPPVPLAAQRQAIEENQGRPLDPAQVDSMRRSNQVRGPLVRIAPTPARQDSGSRVDTPRNDRPRVSPAVPEPVVQPRPDRPRAVPEPVVQPRPDRPRNVEQPRIEQPRPAEGPRQAEQPRPPMEQPRQVEQPRPVERPQQVERPRRAEPSPPVEKQQQVERPRAAEPPRQETPRSEKRSERPARQKPAEKAKPAEAKPPEK